MSHMCDMCASMRKVQGETTNVYFLQTWAFQDRHLRPKLSSRLVEVDVDVGNLKLLAILQHLCHRQPVFIGHTAHLQERSHVTDDPPLCIFCSMACVGGKPRKNIFWQLKFYLVPPDKIPPPRRVRLSRWVGADFCRHTHTLVCSRQSVSMLT